MGDVEKMKVMVPPGFRFHPTDEELLNFYLRRKVDKIFDLDHIVCEIDLNQLEPWDLCEKCKMDVSHQTEWYFFCYKDKKYPSGTRTNRATKVGFWKATGRDKAIFNNPTPPSSRSIFDDHNSTFPRGSHIGMRKTLVFYKGRAPRGLKTDWIMHEYRLYDENTISSSTLAPQPQGHESTGSCHRPHRFKHTSSTNKRFQEDGWVVCRVFKKRNYEERSSCASLSYDLAHEASSNSILSDTSEKPNDSVTTFASNEGPRTSTNNDTNKNGEINYNFNQSLRIMTKTCCKKEMVEEDNYPTHARQYLQLPQLQSPKMTSIVNHPYDCTIDPFSSECMERNHANCQEVLDAFNQALLMTEDLAHLLNNMQTGQHGEQFNWNLSDNIARYHGIEGFVNLANDPKFPNFNMHLNRIVHTIENYPSSFEIDLWDFPQ